MHLIDTLKAQQAAEQSYFRAYLLKEDIARLERVWALAQSSPDAASFHKNCYFQGWSADDIRTGELLPKLEPFLAAVWNHARAVGDTAAIASSWQEFDALRSERLLGCLARVPKPVDG